MPVRSSEYRIVALGWFLLFLAPAAVCHAETVPDPTSAAVAESLDALVRVFAKQVYGWDIPDGVTANDRSNSSCFGAKMDRWLNETNELANWDADEDGLTRPGLAGPVGQIAESYNWGNFKRSLDDQLKVLPYADVVREAVPKAVQLRLKEFATGAIFDEDPKAELHFDASLYPIVSIRWTHPQGGRLQVDDSQGEILSFKRTSAENGLIESTCEIRPRSVSHWGQDLSSLRIAIEVPGKPLTNVSSPQWPLAYTGNVVPLYVWPDWENMYAPERHVYFEDDVTGGRWFVVPRSGYASVSVAGNQLELETGYSIEMPTAVKAGGGELIRIATIHRLIQLGLLADEHASYEQTWAKINGLLEEHGAPSELLADNGLTAPMAELLGGFPTDVRVQNLETNPINLICSALEENASKLVPGLEASWRICNDKGMTLLGGQLNELEKTLLAHHATISEDLFRRRLTIEIPFNVVALCDDDARYFHREVDTTIAGGGELAFVLSGRSEATVSGTLTLTAGLNADGFSDWTYRLCNTKVTTTLTGCSLFGRGRIGLLGFELNNKCDGVWKFESDVEFNGGTEFSAVTDIPLSTWTTQFIPSETVIALEFDEGSFNNRTELPTSLSARAGVLYRGGGDVSKREETDSNDNVISFGWDKVVNSLQDVTQAHELPPLAAAEMVGVIGDAMQAALRNEEFGREPIDLLADASLSSLADFPELFRTDVIAQIEQTFKYDKCPFELGQITAITIDGVDVQYEHNGQSDWRTALKAYPDIIVSVDNDLLVERGKVQRLEVTLNGDSNGDSEVHLFLPREMPDLLEIVACLKSNAICSQDQSVAVKLDHQNGAGKKCVRLTVPALCWKSERQVPLGSLPLEDGLNAIPFTGNATASIALKTDPFTIDLDCNPLADGFKFEANSPLNEIPAWAELLVKKKLSEDGTATGKLKLILSDGREFPLELALKRESLFSNLQQHISPPDAGSLLSISLCNPGGSESSEPGDIRFKIEVTDPALITALRTSAEAKKQKDSSAPPSFQIAPWRENGEIDRNGYLMGMALGLFGADTDHDGKVISPPLHGRSFACNRISFSEPLKVTGSASLAFDGVRADDFDYGIFQVHISDAELPEIAIERSCEISKKACEITLKLGDTIEVTVQEAPQEEAEKSIKIPGTLMPSNTDVEITWSPGTAAKITANGNDLNLGRFSFADSRVTLDTRLDELQRWSEFDLERFYEACKKVDSDSDKVRLLTLRDVLEWIQSTTGDSQRCRFTIQDDKITLSFSSPDETTGKFKEIASLLNFKLYPSPSLLRVFDDVADLLRTWETIETRVDVLNVSLDEFRDLASEFEESLARLRETEVVTLRDLIQSLKEQQRDLNAELSDSGPWVIDLKDNRWLVVSLDLTDALQFTWVRTAKSEQPIDLRRNEYSVLFDPDNAPAAKLNALAVISFGIDLEKLPGSKSVPECLFIGCAPTGMEKWSGGNVTGQEMNGFIGQTLLAGRAQLASQNGDIKGKLLNGIFSHEFTALFSEIPTVEGKWVLPKNDNSENPHRRYLSDTDASKHPLTPSTLEWDDGLKKQLAGLLKGAIKDFKKGIDSALQEEANRDKVLQGIDNALDVELTRLLQQLERSLRGLNRIPVIGGQLDFASEFELPDLRRQISQALETTRKDGHLPKLAELNFEFGVTFQKTFPKKIPFELNIPGLGFQTAKGTEIPLDISLHLQCKLQLSNGNLSVVADNDNSIKLKVTAELPHQLGTARNRLTAVDITCESNVAGQCGGELPNGTHLSLVITCPIQPGPLNGNSLEVPIISGKLHLPLMLTARGNSVDIPRVRTGLSICLKVDSWGEARSLEGLVVTFIEPEIQIADLVDRVLGPAVNQLVKVVQPIDKVVSTLTKPLPVIGELASGITLLDLVKLYAEEEESDSAVEFIKAVVAVREFNNRLEILRDVAKLSDDGEWVKISKLFGGERAGIKLVLQGNQLANSGHARNLLSTLRDLDSAVPPSAPSESITQFTSSVGETEIRMPLLEDPIQALALLLGQDVVLIEIDLPKLKFKFEYSEFFPIIGPIGARFGGEVGATAELGFGYDTYGFRNKKPSDGFYIADWDASGNDRHELTMTAGLFATAEINVVVARAGAGGGLYIDLYLNLHDDDLDGKIRYSEIERIREPQHFFDVGGRLYAKLFAYYEIGFRTMGKWVRIAGDKWDRDIEIFNYDKNPRPQTPESTPVENQTLFVFETNSNSLTILPEARELAAEGMPGAANLRRATQYALALWLNCPAMLLQDTSALVQNVEEDRVTIWMQDGKIFTEVNGLVEGHAASGVKMIKFKADGKSHVTVEASVTLPVELTGSNYDDHLEHHGSGKATISGGKGDDTILGGTGDDMLTGGEGKDTIKGGAGNDVIDGGEKDDLLHGDVGDDTIHGGSGEDTCRGGAGADRIDGGDGNDELYGESGDDLLVGGGETDLLHGGDGDDTLIAHKLADFEKATAVSAIHSLKLPAAYNDSKNDDDSICGTEVTADELYGGDGRDYLIGSGGANKLYGEAGEDYLYGGPGKDQLHGGPSFDRLWGGADDDKLYGGSGSDQLVGGQGADTIYADEMVPAAEYRGPPAVEHWIVGDAFSKEDEKWNGSDSIFVHNDGPAHIWAGNGDNTITSGRGDTTVVAGTGNDKVTDLGGTNSFNLGDGNNVVFSGDGNDQIECGSGNDTVVDQGGENIIQLRDGDNVAELGNGKDSVYCCSGQDKIVDTGGVAFIALGAGRNTLTLGTMDSQTNDTYSVYAGVTVKEKDGSPSWTFPDKNEPQEITIYPASNGTIITGNGDDRIQVQGSGGATILSYGGSDVIATGLGEDRIAAGDGDDTVSSGGGNDVIIGDDTTPGKDKLDGGAGQDFICGDLLPGEIPRQVGQDSQTDIAWFEKHFLSTDNKQSPWLPVNFLQVENAADLFADDLENSVPKILSKGSVSDTGGGDDEIDGGDDNDWLFGGGGQDTISGGAGTDYLDGGSGDDFLYGDAKAPGESDGESDVMLGGPGNDQLYGGGGLDQLYGGSGDDELFGEACEGSIVNGEKLSVSRRLGESVKLLRPKLCQRLWGEDGSDTLHAFAKDAEEASQWGDELYGGNGNDYLYGNQRKDLLVGGNLDTSSGDGPDYLHGDYHNGPNYKNYPDCGYDKGADDILFGDLGSDQLYGGGGDDHLFGSEDNDWLEGMDGNDKLYGGSGPDLLIVDVFSQYSNKNNDDFDGHGTNRPEDSKPDDAVDILVVIGDRTTNQEKKKIDDEICLREHPDAGKELQLQLDYNGQVYELTWCVKENNSLVPLVEQFQIQGLDGNDTIEVGVPEQIVDSLAVKPGASQLTDGSIDFDNLSMARPWLTTITGGPGNDTIHGTAGRDYIDGGAGNDKIYGHAGDDRLRGGDHGNTEFDALYAGLGNDDLLAGSGLNILSAWDSEPQWQDEGDALKPNIAAAKGKVEPDVDTGVNRMLGSSKEDFLFGGTGIDLLYGNGGNDSLYTKEFQLFEDNDSGAQSAQWIEYAKSTDRCWYLGGSDGVDKIDLNFVTNPYNPLFGRHVATFKSRGSFEPFVSGMDRLIAYAVDGGALHDDLTRTLLVTSADTPVDSKSVSADQRQKTQVVVDSPLRNIQRRNSGAPIDDVLAIVIDAGLGDDEITVGETVQKTVWIAAGPEVRAEDKPEMSDNDTVTIEPQRCFLPDRTELGDGDPTYPNVKLRNDTPKEEVIEIHSWFGTRRFKTKPFPLHMLLKSDDNTEVKSDDNTKGITGSCVIGNLTIDSARNETPDVDWYEIKLSSELTIFPSDFLHILSDAEAPVQFEIYSAPVGKPLDQQPLISFAFGTDYPIADVSRHRFFFSKLKLGDKQNSKSRFYLKVWQPQNIPTNYQIEMRFASTPDRVEAEGPISSHHLGLISNSLHLTGLTLHDPGDTDTFSFTLPEGQSLKEGRIKCTVSQFDSGHSEGTDGSQPTLRTITELKSLSCNNGTCAFQIDHSFLKNATITAPFVYSLTLALEEGGKGLRKRSLNVDSVTEIDLNSYVEKSERDRNSDTEDRKGEEHLQWTLVVRKNDANDNSTYNVVVDGFEYELDGSQQKIVIPIDFPKEPSLTLKNYLLASTTPELRRDLLINKEFTVLNLDHSSEKMFRISEDDLNGNWDQSANFGLSDSDRLRQQIVSIVNRKLNDTSFRFFVWNGRLVLNSNNPKKDFTVEGELAKLLGFSEAMRSQFSNPLPTIYVSYAKDGHDTDGGGLTAEIVSSGSSRLTHDFAFDLQKQPVVDARNYDLFPLASRRDVIFGGIGNDRLLGGSGEDWIFGGDGNDVLCGGPDRQASDLIFGGDGDDLFQIVTDRWPILPSTGREGDPALFDELDGGNGIDRILYLGGDEVPRQADIPRHYIRDYVMLGYDRFLARYRIGTLPWTVKSIRSEGTDDGDFLLRHDGNPAVFYSYFQAKNVEATLVDTRGGRDVIHADPGFYFGPSGQSWGISPGDVQAGATSYRRIELRGGDGADLIYGSSGSDTIYGGDDADIIAGGDGDDRLLGGRDGDFLFGQNVPTDLSQDRRPQFEELHDQLEPRTTERFADLPATHASIDLRYLYPTTADHAWPAEKLFETPVGFDLAEPFSKERPQAMIEDAYELLLGSYVANLELANNKEGQAVIRFSIKVSHREWTGPIRPEHLFRISTSPDYDENSAGDDLLVRGSDWSYIMPSQNREETSRLIESFTLQNLSGTETTNTPATIWDFDGDGERDTISQRDVVKIDNQDLFKAESHKTVPYEVGDLDQDGFDDLVLIIDPVMRDGKLPARLAEFVVIMGRKDEQPWDIQSDSYPPRCFRFRRYKESANYRGEKTKNLRIGDFDGNGVVDLLLHDTVIKDGPPKDRLSVVYDFGAMVGKNVTQAFLAANETQFWPNESKLFYDSLKVLALVEQDSYRIVQPDEFDLDADGCDDIVLRGPSSLFNDRQSLFVVYGNGRAESVPQQATPLTNLDLPGLGHALVELAGSDHFLKADLSLKAGTVFKPDNSSDGVVVPGNDDAIWFRTGSATNIFGLQNQAERPHPQTFATGETVGIYFRHYGTSENQGQPGSFKLKIACLPSCTEPANAESGPAELCEFIIGGINSDRGCEYYCLYNNGTVHAYARPLMTISDVVDINANEKWTLLTPTRSSGAEQNQKSGNGRSGAQTAILSVGGDDRHYFSDFTVTPLDQWFQVTFRGDGQIGNYLELTHPGGVFLQPQSQPQHAEPVTLKSESLDKENTWLIDLSSFSFKHTSQNTNERDQNGEESVAANRPFESVKMELKLKSIGGTQKGGKYQIDICVLGDLEHVGNGTSQHTIDIGNGKTGIWTPDGAESVSEFVKCRLNELIARGFTRAKIILSPAGMTASWGSAELSLSATPSEVRGVVADLYSQDGRFVRGGRQLLDLRHVKAGTYFLRVSDPFSDIRHPEFTTATSRTEKIPYEIHIRSPKFGGFHPLTDRDEIFGENGDDVIVGGPDADRLIGGAGEDTSDRAAGAPDDDVNEPQSSQPDNRDIVVIRERESLTDTTKAVASALHLVTTKGTLRRDIKASDLAELVALDLSRVENVNNLDVLQYAINLRRLIASGNSGIASLAALEPKEHDPDLDGDEGCPQLQILVLDDTGIGDDQLPVIATMKSLRHLSINRTCGTSCGPFSELSALKELETLNAAAKGERHECSTEAQDGRNLLWILPMTRLRHLRLPDRDLVSIEPIVTLMLSQSAKAGNPPRLRELNVRNNCLKEIHPAWGIVAGDEELLGPQNGFDGNFQATIIGTKEEGYVNNDFAKPGTDMIKLEFSATLPEGYRLTPTDEVTFFLHTVNNEMQTSAWIKKESFTLDNGSSVLYRSSDTVPLDAFALQLNGAQSLQRADLRNQRAKPVNSSLTAAFLSLLKLNLSTPPEFHFDVPDNTAP